MNTKRVMLLGLVVSAVVALTVLAGCSSAGAGSTTVTVSGNVTASNLDITSAPIVAIEGTSSFDSAAVGLFGTITAAQTKSYSISNLASGTYQLIVAFEANNSSLGTATYSINGGTAKSLSNTTPSGSNPSSYSLTATVTLSGDTTIDITIGG